MHMIEGQNAFAIDCVQGGMIKTIPFLMDDYIEVC